MSEKTYELKKSVEIGYPGKYENKPGSHGKFRCETDEKGNFIPEKDDYDLKEYFSPAERESFYGHVKGLLQGLENKYPVSETVVYKEAETLTNEKTGNTYQKLKQDGEVIKETTYNRLDDAEKKNYKRSATPDMAYKITGYHYEKDGKSRDNFQLEITFKKSEAIRVTYDKNCQATFIQYNKDNSFSNGKPAAENKWVNLNNDVNIASPILANFAKDISATIVRGERTPAKLPTIYTEVNQYIKDNSPKVQNAEGKEVSAYYSTGYHFANSPMKDKDGNVLKDDNGETRKYNRPCFTFMNHSSEAITFNLVDGDIASIGYRNFETKDNFYSSDHDALAKVSERCVDKAFAAMLTDALVNYQEKAEKVNEEVAKAADDKADDKADDFMQFNENDQPDLPF